MCTAVRAILVLPPYGRARKVNVPGWKQFSGHWSEARADGCPARPFDHPVAVRIDAMAPSRGNEPLASLVWPDWPSLTITARCRLRRWVPLYCHQRQRRRYAERLRDRIGRNSWCRAPHLSSIVSMNHKPRQFVSLSTSLPKASRREDAAAAEKLMDCWNRDYH
jgi:hypothetical protein